MTPEIKLEFLKVFVRLYEIALSQHDDKMANLATTEIQKLIL